MAAKHLDALERRLGITLLRRSTRRLSLTEAGRDLLDHAERLLLELAEAEASASSRTVAIEGPLRVSAPVSFGVLHVAPLVGGFTGRHHGVAIELGLSDRFVDLMDEGWDMAIRIGRLGESNLMARRLAPVASVVCAAPAYLRARGSPRTLADLARHDCFVYTLSSGAKGGAWRFGPDGEIEVPVRSSLRANNGEALIAAAIAGQGLVYGPRFIAAAALADGRLEAVTLEAPLHDVGAVFAVTHPDRRPAAKTRAWIDYLAETLPERAGR